MDDKRKKQLKELQSKLKVKFKKTELLNLSLTHSSYAHEIYHNEDHNEKLELLGDAVLSFVITEYLYRKYRDSSESFLAHLKSFIISEPFLFKVAKKMALNKYILLGRGEEKSGGRNKSSVLADSLEGLIGAVFMDAGIVRSKRFILKYFEPFIKEFKKNIEDIKDWKSRFQEIAQKLFKLNPEYFIIKEEGPDHRKQFQIAVKVGNRIFGKGTGFNKKEAEKQAAEDAMRHL
ncbi:MAG: ribonuclease III [Spirochaetes bacterium]|nr:ribonuclease III [Spirochaetota bacterium]